MTTMTRNLPWFMKLGVSIIGEVIYLRTKPLPLLISKAPQKCYLSLVENLHITDTECLKLAISKALGIGIVIGGSIMKLPQLLLITSARSARGLSLPAFVLETLAYGITSFYSSRNSFPFSTYGESVFLTIQNTIITFLIIYYPTASLRRSQNISSRLATAFVVTVTTSISLCIIPKTVLSLLQVLTLPISLFSKLPQIQQNARSKSTGQLSAFAVISQVIGCLARLFTTATEVGDWLVATGFALALVLNGILGVQMWMYWGQDVEEEIELGKPRMTAGGGAVREKGQGAARYGPAEIVLQPRTPTERWSRKAD